MKHKHHRLAFWFHDDCPRCWLRRFQYGYRLEPVAYMKDREKFANDPRFSNYEKVWLLNKVRPIEINYE